MPAGSGIRDPGRVGADQWVVEYVEPLAGNEVVRGLDLAAEPRRREAIETACSTDRPAATNPVRLFQERATSLGVVVFGPVYDRGPALHSMEERQAACSGLMIVVYRAFDLLAGIRDRNPGLDFELYDLGSVPAAATDAVTGTPTLLFDVDDRAEGLKVADRQAMVDVHGRRWLIALTAADRQIAGVSAGLVAVLAVGFMTSAVVSVLVLRLATFRRRALARGRLVAASDRDRRSLERDLHDGAQQRLLSVALMLVRARHLLPADSDAGPLLTTASAELDRSLQELRNLAAGLHPAVVADHGLAVAAEGVAARAQVPVDLRLAINRRLPQHVEIAAYFVLCEAVTNAIKHAGASRITVVIRVTRRHLSIEVSDDGVGISPSSTGSGLRGLTDRCEALDGRLRVQSRAGRGTLVIVRIPCA
jgi:signal transduction histidine kinase